MKRDGVVVALQGDVGGGEGADDGDGLMPGGIEGKEVIVVFEQDHGFAGGAEG